MSSVQFRSDGCCSAESKRGLQRTLHCYVRAVRQKIARALNCGSNAVERECIIERLCQTRELLAKPLISVVLWIGHCNFFLVQVVHSRRIRLYEEFRVQLDSLLPDYFRRALWAVLVQNGESPSICELQWRGDHGIIDPPRYFHFAFFRLIRSALQFQTLIALPMASLSFFAV
jgi:hypothetical protein